ncbi:MAG: ABC transporter permease [Meiothermus sp.]|nr:ABC transporter permease [Meiothermus sp.]
MKRLWSTLGLDFRQQWRNGFYSAALFVTAFWLLGLHLTPLKGAEPAVFVPLFVGLNALLTAFYFVAAQVLLEKGEGTLAGLSVTPLRRGEYLAAKVLSLAAVTLLEGLLVLLSAFGPPHSLPLLLLGMLVTSALYTLVGFWLTSRYESLNELLMPSVLATLFLLLPLLGVLGVPWFWLAWHPLTPALILAQAGAGPLPGGWVLYGLAGAAVWVWLWLWLARGAFDRFVRPGAAGEG